MSLPEFSMKYRPIVISIVFVLTAWGVHTYLNMPRREDPQFTIRTAVVATQWPGVPAGRVEKLVTDKLESELGRLEEVDFLRSETTNGQSIIYVNLTDQTPVDQIPNVWDKVRAKVANVSMPDENVKPSVNAEFGDTAVLVLGVYQVPTQGEQTVAPARQYTVRQLELHADKVQEAIRLLPGVAKVEKFGVQREAIYLETSLANWAKLNLTTQQLRDIVSSRNTLASGGSIDTPSGNVLLRPTGQFDVVDQIKSQTATLARESGGATTTRVALADLGIDVNRKAIQPAERYCRFTDKTGTYPAVMLGVTMRSGANIIDVCQSATARIDRLVNVQRVLPGDIRVKPVSNMAENVDAKIRDVITNVISAILIVVVVVYLCVGLRTALVMAANIPIVVLVSLALVRCFGIELEQITLASIIIALGLLVDNAVQVCDQTRSNLLDGMSPTEAAVAGARTLMFPMLSGTLTTVAAFLPMLYALTGDSGEYVFSLPVTLSITLLVSWLMAMTICVVLAASFIRVSKTEAPTTAPALRMSRMLFAIPITLGKRLANRSTKIKTEGTTTDLGMPEAGSSEINTSTGEGLVLKLYDVTSRIAIRHKWLTVGGTLVVLLATLSLPVSSEFFPQDRRDQFFVNVELPATSTIEQTNQVVQEVEHVLRRLSPTVDADGKPIERLRAMRSLIGQGGSRWALGLDPLPPGANTAEVLVRTTSGFVTDSYMADARRVFEQGDSQIGLPAITGARLVPKKLALGPPAPPIELRVSGEGYADADRLRSIADAVKTMVRQHPGTWNVTDSWGIDASILDVEVDHDKASLSGVSSQAIADTLATYYSGYELTKYREGDHEIPVMLRLSADQLNDISGIKSAYVEGKSGKVPLTSVADFVQKWEPAKIERRNQNRSIRVTAEVEQGIQSNDVVLAILNSDPMRKLVQSLPPGYQIEIGGALEESQDAEGQVGLSMVISVISIILILIIQYNGWSKMLIILTTLPMSMIGAWLGLYVTGEPLGFMPQLGLLSLFGIVLNTGIIFIEFADTLIAEKKKEIAKERRATSPGGRLVAGRLMVTEFRDCLTEAGKQRMLPIFLTTATTVGGLIPLALSGGPLWEGLAWLMIFGLSIATVLTLYVIPALYAIAVETFGIRRAR